MKVEGATMLLEHHIGEVMHRTRSEPTIIVVHPDTFRELMQCFLKDQLNFFVGNMYFSGNSTFMGSEYKLTYRGIKILRSLDVEPGTFES